MKSLENIFTKRDSVLALSLVLDETVSPSYNLLLLKSEKEEIIIAERWEGEILDIGSLKVLAEHPIVVVLDGTGVLHKAVKGLEEGIDLAGQIIPGARREDFLSQQVQMNNGTLLSMIRRPIVEDILSSFSTSHLIVDVRLGSFSSSALLEELFPSSITGTFQRLSLEEGKMHLDDIVEERVYNLDDVQFSNKEIASVMGGMNWLLHDETEPVLPSVVNGREDHRYKSLTKKVGMIGVFSLLALLLLNFFISDHLLERYDALNTLLSNSLGEHEEIERLEAKILQDKDLSRFVAMDRNYSLSVLADHIAESVPPEISLTTLSLNPFHQGSDKKKRLSIQKDVVEIVGVTAQESELSAWVNTVKSMPDFSSVELTKIQKNGRTGLHEFEIRLRL